MSLFIGIDQSVLHTGICILDADGNLVRTALIEPERIKNRERLAYIRDELASVFKDLRFEAGVMEGYSYGSINKKFLLGEVGAIIKLALFDYCDHCFEVAPKQLKKFVTSRASASKEDVMLAIEKRWNVVLDNDNIADAYGLARIGYALRRTQTLHRCQLDVLNKLRNSDLKKPRKPRNKRLYKEAL